MSRTKKKPSAIARNCQRTAASWSPKTRTAWKNEFNALQRTRRVTGVGGRGVACARDGAGHSVDEYLETIYFLAFPIGEYHPRETTVPTLSSRVAEMLGVSRASAGEMLKRLEAEGLVERGEHKEAILTETGRARAERAVRKHRIIERLLTDFMGYTAAEAHVHADELGDTFSDDMVERIGERLGNPERCPHGWPIDTDFEQAENLELEPLSALEPGRPRDDRPARRARRRAPALVLRRGPRPRGAASSSRRRSRPPASSASASTAARRRSARRPPAGLFVRPGRLGR